MSLFELPVAPAARITRIVVVLLLDAVLAGAGIAMILSYWSGRHAAAAPPAATRAEDRSADAGPAPIHVEVPAAPTRVAKAGKKPKSPVGPAPGPVVPGPVPPPEPAAEPDAAPAAVPPASVPDAAPAPAPVTGGPPDEDVEFSADGVREVVQQHMVQVKRCYERAAKQSTRNDPIGGKLEIQFTVQPSGEATDVAVASNDTGSEALGGCVVALLQSWRFPSPPEPIEFVWPFVFRAPK